MEDERPWSFFAIIGFILSFFGIFAILGIVFSAIGISETNNRMMKGRGLAIAGLIIGIIIFTFSIITIIGILVALPISGFLTPGTIDESIVNGQTKITISGINFERDLNYSKNIILQIDGINNQVRISQGTNLSRVNINGINNKLILCEGVNSPEAEQVGVNNKVFHETCNSA